MVLHNLFFLVLTCAAYFTLIPLFERQVQDALEREQRILELSGSTDWRREITISQTESESAVRRAKITLFLVLGVIYLLAVLLLEALIMPQYVYGPLRRMLDADEATRRGDRERELIRNEDIPGDEIGQIMRSRNSTVEELRQHEDELAAALQRLEEQDRLVSLGLLSASVAHELNTPLAVLAGSIEKLLETNPDPQTRERLVRMQRVADRLRRISESLVDFSRVRKQHMEPTSARALVDESWQLVGIDEKASQVTFVNSIAPEHWVTANPDRLEQVFVNLLRNALHSVSPGGRIEVRSEQFRKGGKPWVSIIVEDDGPGIPADVLPDIFDAFVTTRLDAKGTGLGLTVAEGIVTQHGGTISAGNRPEGGARLVVSLPAASPLATPILDTPVTRV
jgi:signal transduction histidine kinase